MIRLFFPVIFAAVLLNAAIASAVLKPRIGISGSSLHSPSVKAIMQQITKRGGQAIFLDQAQPLTRAQLRSFDGVIIGGNRYDIDPATYGQAPHPKTLNEAANKQTKQRGSFEFALLDSVIETDTPFLGICSGMQRLNVTNHAQDSGTLLQHIDGQNQYPLGIPATKATESVRLLAGTNLPRLLGANDLEIKENSLHHQTIGRLRRGFRVSARESLSGSVEAIEPLPNGPYGKHPFLIGVQWHPEYLASQESAALWDQFMQAARKRQQQR